MALANKHSVYFGGKIIEATVTDKAAVADDWVQNVQSPYNVQNIVAGLDCKFKPHPIRSLSNKIASLQICIDTKCLVFRLLHMDYIPQSIKSFLSDPKITFVGFEVQHNSLKLGAEYEIFVGNKVDIRALAKLWLPITFSRQSSMRGLAYKLAGLTIQKTNKPYTCDWESLVLDKQMIDHASIDANVSYRIAHKLLN